MLFVSSGCCWGVRAVLCAVAMAVACHAGELPFSEAWTTPFQDTFGKATLMEVYPFPAKKVNGKDVCLLKVDDAKQVRDLVMALQFQSNDVGTVCMCMGRERLNFYADGALLGSVSLHHGQRLRWKDGPWKADGVLTKKSADFLCEWLAARGVDRPKKEYEESMRQLEILDILAKRWADATPEVLRPFLEGESGGLLWSSEEKSAAQRTAMHSALAKAYPGEGDRIRVLLCWYGSGEGVWSGSYTYEDAPMKLLLDYPTPQILLALEGAQWTPALTEGTARFFADGDFRKAHPGDEKLLSPELKARLLAHAMASADKDKQGRARQAFGP